MNETLATAIAEGPLREWAIALLSNVPGLPPISQTLHILGIAVVMASAVLIDLRILGLALPSQPVGQMIRRLGPWVWWALALNFVTGLPFILARPYRYFLNPVFGWKIGFLIPALLLVLLMQRLNSSASQPDSGPDRDFWDDPSRRLWTRAVAFFSLVLWLGVIFSGRWIAYSDYLFWTE